MSWLTLARLRFDQAGFWWLWLLILGASAGLLWFAYRGMYGRSGRQLGTWLFVMRLLAVAVLFVALIKPSWQTTHISRDKPIVDVVVDTSQSMAVSDGDVGSNKTRYAAMQQWLEQSPQGRTLHDEFDIHAFDIAGRRLKGNTLPDQPTAEQTDLAAALRSVASYERGRHIAGVVLLSDGRDTIQPANDANARQPLSLPDDAAATYAICVGSQAKLGDRASVRVRQVLAPAKAFVGNEVPIRVTVAKSAGEKRAVVVAISRGTTELASRRIELAKGAVYQQVVIHYTPEHAGDFVLHAAVKTDGTTSDDSGGRLFKLRVNDKPMRVLYVEGVLRPEFSYLRSHLTKDPDVDLLSFVRSIAGKEVGSSGELFSGQLLTARRLSKIDVILLGDFDASMLSGQAYRRIARWVAGGGGLMVLGGYHNLGSRGLPATPLEALLPMRGAQTRQINAPFRFDLTAEGLRWPALSITGDAVEDGKLWASLPRLAGLVATNGVKAGATVLARDQAAKNPATGKGYPVLIKSTFGKGLVVVMAADTTWRWSRIVRMQGRPDTLYVRFWSQIIRTLARRNPAPDRPAVTITTDKTSYRPGEAVTITARQNPAAMLPAPGDSGPRQVTIAVRGPAGHVSHLPTKPDPANPLKHVTRFYPGQGGRYTAAVNVAKAGGDRAVIANGEASFAVTGSAIEMRDTTPDPATLKGIARITGGRFASIGDQAAMKQILAAIPRTERLDTSVQTTQLWDSPILLVIFVALLSGEWLIRRRHRLV